MTAPNAGYEGDVYIGGVKVAMTTWAYTGGTRVMQPIDEFGDEHIKHLPLQVEGGEITLTGYYKLNTDEGQKLLGTRFDAGTEITDLKLYTKYSTVYLTPKADSYVTVTNYNNVSDEKSGICAITATLKVSGVLEQQGSTTVVSAAMVGIHNLIATSVNFVGRLTSMGGETPISCFFDYGEDISYSDGPTSTPDSLTAIGIFEDISGLLVTSTLYHWRVHVTWDAGASHVVGPDQTFTTP